MLTWKQSGAIALTLIVIVPILMGYAMATETKTVTEYETSQQTGISDLLLNYEQPYYMVSQSSGNNSELLRSVNTGGTWQRTIVAPEYAEISGTYSAMPQYGTQSGSLNYSGYISESYTVSKLSGGVYVNYNSDFPGAGVGADLSGYTDLGSHGLYAISATSLSRLYLDNGLLLRPDAGVTVFAAQVSDSSYLVEYNGKLYSTSGFLFGSDLDVTITVKIGDYAVLASSHDCSYVAYSVSAIRMTKADGSSEVAMSTGSVPPTLIKTNSGVVTYGSSSYRGVTALEYAQASASAVSYTYSIPTGQYAQPSAGWTLPASGGTSATTYAWLNSQLNQSVTFMVSLGAAASMSLTPSASISMAGAKAVSLSYSGGSLKASYDGTSTVLGSYSKAAVTISMDGVTVAGLTAWPSMGGAVSGLNKVTFSADIEEFVYVDVAAVGDVHLRADSAQIRAGTFPATKDYTFKVAEYFPNYDMASMELQSVGVYGDSITIGKTSYAVEDGRITVGGSQVSLKGAVISAWPGGDGAYDYKINGLDLEDCDEALTVMFGGEWSLTAAVYDVDKIEAEKTSWAPGVFAFDTQDVVVAAILTAVGAFVVLGATGRASGTKVAVLALICGGAVAVLMTML